MWKLQLVGADLRVEAPPDAPDEVLDLARRLDPAEPGAADDERELRLPLFGVALEVGTLEHLDDPVAEGERIGQRLHADRVLGDALDPERGRLAAERDDQACRSSADADRRRRPGRSPASRRGRSASTSAVTAQLDGRRSCARRAVTQWRASRLPEQTSGRSGVKSVKFSRLTTQISTSSRRRVDASRDGAPSRRPRSRHPGRGSGAARAARIGRSCASAR